MAAGLELEGGQEKSTKIYAGEVSANTLGLVTRNDARRHSSSQSTQRNCHIEAKKNRDRDSCSATAKASIRTTQKQTKQPLVRSFPSHQHNTAVRRLTHRTMSLSTTIPRFLLPRGSAVRHPRLALSQSSSLPLVRHASKFGKKPQPPPKSSKPLVLEKPTKFNPPSHGSRLRRPTPRYGAPLTAEEKSIQAKKKYPTMMAPEGTFMHWFMHNRSIHTWITLVRQHGRFIGGSVVS